MATVSNSRLPTRRLRAWLASWLVGAMAAKAALADGAQSAEIEVDKQQGEIRLPCKFVNPSRLIEVFACNKAGPTHETVLEFDATRTGLTQALLAIGCRTASYWNGTSPGDFEKNQGDRVLVLVRWEHGGQKHEHAAEGILTDGETGFPMFVRAFSFGARGAFKIEPRKDEAEDAAGGEGVEISLGAALRQTPPHSVVSHPTSSRVVQPWMLAPFLDTRVVERHREMVEGAVPATLILRRLRSETELIAIARASAKAKGLAGSDALYDAIAPIAGEVDALKAQYEALLADLKKAVEAAAPAGASEAERAALGARVEGLVRRGRWLCAKIEERYLSQYGLEEAYKVAWVEKQKELPDEVREQAIILARDGFRLEPLLARKRVALEDLDSPSFEGSPGERNLRTHLLKAEMEALELERGHALTLSNVHYVETRLEESKNDAYLRRLFEEDWLRQKAIASQYAARRKLADTEIQEVQGLLDGSWDAKEAVVQKSRARAQEELEIAKLEEQAAVLLEETRYAEADLESNDSERKASAADKLAELKAKKSSLEADLKARQSKLSSK